MSKLKTEGSAAIEFSKHGALLSVHVSIITFSLRSVKLFTLLDSQCIHP
jgi:hypothetical protein